MAHAREAEKKDEVTAADAAKEKQPEVTKKEEKEKAKRERAMGEVTDVRTSQKKDQAKRDLGQPRKSGGGRE